MHFCEVAKVCGGRICSVLMSESILEAVCSSDEGSHVSLILAVSNQATWKRNELFINFNILIYFEGEYDVVSASTKEVLMKNWMETLNMNIHITERERVINNINMYIYMYMYMYMYSIRRNSH